MIPSDGFFYPHQTIMIDSFSCIPFDFNVGITINESRYYTLTSAILKFDVVCDVIMTSTTNVLTTELCDVLYNQYIGNTCCYSFFIIPSDRIRVCEIRFVSNGENRRKACLVCKKTSFRAIFLLFVYILKIVSFLLENEYGRFRMLRHKV